MGGGGMNPLPSCAAYGFPFPRSATHSLPLPPVQLEQKKESRPSASQEVVEVLAAAPLAVIGSASSAVTKSESEDNSSWLASRRKVQSRMDILEYSSVAREDFSRSLEIQQILMDAGLIRRQNNENDNPNSAVAAAADVVSPSPRRVEKKWWFLTELKNWYGYPRDWVKDLRGMLMVVATMISTMTFQAVVNPPGGVWDHNDTNTTLGNITICSESRVCKAGTAVLSYYGNASHVDFADFIAYNTISFFASVSVTILLVSGLPLHNRLSTWLLPMFMCYALLFLACTYLAALSIIDPKYSWVSWVAPFSFLSAALVVSGLLQGIRSVSWLTSVRNNMIGIFSRIDPTRFEENDAPAVV